MCFFSWNSLAPLATMTSTSAIDDAIQRKLCGNSVIREVKGIILVISNEDINDVIKIIKPLQNSGVVIDEFIETVKNQIKNR